MGEEGSHFSIFRNGEIIIKRKLTTSKKKKKNLFLMTMRHLFLFLELIIIIIIIVFHMKTVLFYETKYGLESLLYLHNTLRSAFLCVCMCMCSWILLFSVLFSRLFFFFFFCSMCLVKLQARLIIVTCYSYYGNRALFTNGTTLGGGTDTQLYLFLMFSGSVWCSMNDTVR